MPFTILAQLTEQRVSDLLCCALEGGSNYWYTIKKFIEPSEISIVPGQQRFGFQMNPDHVYRHLDYPLNPERELTVIEVMRSIENA